MTTTFHVSTNYLLSEYCTLSKSFPLCVIYHKTHLKRRVYTNVSFHLGIAEYNVLLCTLCIIACSWGAPGHFVVHLAFVSCVACWERDALNVVPFLCLGPMRLSC